MKCNLELHVEIRCKMFQENQVENFWGWTQNTSSEELLYSCMNSGPPGEVSFSHSQRRKYIYR